MYSGPEVTLPEILAHRDQRAQKQKKLIATYQKPVISLTINMPGGIKLNQISQVAFAAAMTAIIKDCQSGAISIVDKQISIDPCGPEALLVVGGVDVRILKQRLISIESFHPLGRLFDIDVIGVDGKPLSREAFKQHQRRCFVCDAPAKVCARSRAHTLSQIIQKMSELVYEYDETSELAS